MELTLLIVLSFAPGLFWLWFYLRTNRVRPTPKGLVALSFVMGAFAVAPAALIEALLIRQTSFNDLSSVAVSMLFVVGPVEETSKFLAVRFGAFRSKYFEQPVDGLVHAMAAALGFASVENLLYINRFGPEVMVVRAPLSTMAHLVLSSVWGYGLGVYIQSEHKNKWVLVGSLAGAAALHGIFDIAAFTQTFGWVSPIIVIIGGIWAYKRIGWGQRVSPFRMRRNYPLVPCANCGQPMRVIAAFCTSCGAPATRDPTEIICGNCKHENRPDALYCAFCGDRFLTHI